LAWLLKSPRAADLGPSINFVDHAPATWGLARCCSPRNPQPDRDPNKINMACAISALLLLDSKGKPVLFRDYR
jgi:hypothetical protein